MNTQSNGSSKKVAVILIIILFVLAGSTGAWYWLMHKPKQEAKEKARLEQLAEAEAEAERKRKEEAAQKQAKYENLIENADTEFGQENWETALSFYSEASSLFPEQQYPQDQLILVNTKLDEMVAVEAKKVSGIVERISSPTGRFYSIVSSSIDEDLAIDYANKLAKEGNSVKIIEHDAIKLLYYRVALGDYATLEQAKASLTSFSSYGEGVWILKY